MTTIASTFRTSATRRLFLVLLSVSLLALPAFAQRENGQPKGDPMELIRALSSGNVFVSESMQGKVDEAALQAAIDRAQPTAVKIVVVQNTPGYSSRAALADDLRQRLQLPDDGVVLVAQEKGVSASSGRLSRDQIADALKTAKLDTAFAQNGLTGALVRAVEATTGTVVSDRRTETGKNGGLVFGGLALVAGWIGVSAYRKKKSLDDAKAPLVALRKEALDNLSYVDGYLDLLPPGVDGDRAKQMRASAYQAYSTANGIFQTAQTPEQMRQAGPLLQQAVADLAQCRMAIDKATGGTGVAMTVPELPSLQTDAQRGQAYLKSAEQATANERGQMQQEIESIPADQRGVSFFSGRPFPASELIPVTIVVQGQKRTVMASRDEASAIARGETPPVRAFDDGGGRYVPWYEYRGYDPYRDYYGGSQMGTMVDLYLLSNLMGGGMFGGYGPWGYGGWGYGMSPVFVDNTYYGADYGGGTYGGFGGGGDNSGGGYYDGGNGGQVMETTPEHAADFNFFGGGDTSGGGDNGSDNSSGFDFFGGGGDSGGDFGGGDSGGGDSGGGGGDW